MGTSKSFMPMYWGDYLRDTQGLSQAEHGAYLLLIAHYWNTGELPVEKSEIYIIARAFDKKSRQIVDKILRKFFKIQTQFDGKDEYENYQHKRLNEELKKAEESHNRRVLAGSRGGVSKAKKASNASSIATAKPEQSSSNHNHNHNHNSNTAVSKETAALLEPPPPLFSKMDEPEPFPCSDDVPQDVLDFLIRAGEPEKTARSVLQGFCQEYGEDVLREAMTEAVAKNKNGKLKRPVAYFRTLVKQFAERAKFVEKADEANWVESKNQAGEVVKIRHVQAARLMNAKAVKWTATGKVYRGEELRQLFLLDDKIPAFWLPYEEQMVSLGQFSVINEAFADDELRQNHWAVRAGLKPAQDEHDFVDLATFAVKEGVA